MKVTDHNGKAIKQYEGNNVRIPPKSYEKLRKFIYAKGWRIGWFFEQAALEKMEHELQKEKK
jgi:hypothetical protein